MMQTLLQKNADEIDLDVFRLISRVDTIMDGCTNIQRADWRYVRRHLQDARNKTRQMMSEQQRRKTSAV